MRKFYYLSAVFAALALASCSSDDFLNEVPNEHVAKQELISFGGDNFKASRVVSGENAATLLNNQFYVYATKGTTPTVVMDNYELNWEGTTSAGSTDTNPKGWEYVGYTSKQGSKQDAKYWDFSADRYDFVAVTGLAATEKITSTNAGFKVKITDASQMTNVYFADRVSAKATAAAAVPGTSPEFVAYKDIVTFNFRRLNSKMRVGFYETIPGYAVRNLKFYYVGAAGGSPVVGMGGDYPVSGEFEVTYDVDNKAHASFTPGATNAVKNYNQMGKLVYTNALNTMGVTGKPNLAADGTATDADNKQFLGTSAADPTWAVGKYTVDHVANVETAWKPILPYETNAKEITLRVNYELVSLDGSKETIYVRNATAKVPVEYCQWKPNYAYTYLFKISDNTNGTTTKDPGVNPDPNTPDVTPVIPDPTDPEHPTDPTNPGDGDPDPSNPDDPDTPGIIPVDPNAGLYPITFDACVIEETSVEETITTVAKPSITTHADGSDVVGNDEYKVGEKIVLSVPADVTVTGYDYVVSATAITELSAETQDAAGQITGWTTIAASAGKYILTPSAAGYYVVRLTYGTGEKAYKVIKVD